MKEEQVLSRIEKITGLGLLHDAGVDLNCNRVTLIYGENARGKSTLSALLRSVKTGDVTEVDERCTIGGTLPLSARLKFDKNIHVELKDGAWTAVRGELVVFDSDFVHRNVYSGIEVTTTHRKNLLDFALGDKAVTARQTSINADAAHHDANGASDKKALELSPHHEGKTFAQFKALDKPADYARSKADLTQQLANAQEAAVILAATVPAEIPIPALELDAYVATLSKSLDNVASDAERIVREQVGTLVPEVESWLSDGQKFDNHSTCPYCAQSTENVDLVASYRAVFNEKYTRLKEEVDLLTSSIGAALPVDMSDSIASRIESINETLSGWATRCTITFLSFSKKEFDSKIEAVRAALDRHVAGKKQNLSNYAIEPKDRADLEAAAEAMKSSVRMQNTVMAANIKAISEFKETLAAADSSSIEAQITALEMQAYRHGVQGTKLVSEVDATIATASAARKAKEAARAALSEVMDNTLSDYKEGTNKHLKDLGANFQIGRLSGNYRSGGRSEFSIEMRGGQVRAEGGKPTFATALSESDKRTLALAFFLASAIDPTTIATKTIVIDDPVSSFDSGRSKRTATILTKIQSEAEQLIVLSHDKFFLRTLKQKIDRTKPAVPVTVLGIDIATGQYSDINKLEIDVICESDYYRNYRTVRALVNGDQVDPFEAAKSIRPLIEGYLHRRFPALLDSTQVLGTSITAIRNAVPSSPLAHAQAVVTQLQEINDNTSQYHHDEGERSTAGAPDLQEVRSYSADALAIIYGSVP